MDIKERTTIFKQWLTEHKGLIFKVVRANAFIPQDQEDLFQEITTQLWRSVTSFKQNSSETTWIYRVAFFSAMSWNRKEHRHRQGKSTLDEAMPHSEFVSEKQDPRLIWLYEQINQMPMIDRSLTLLLLDGYRYKEISSILGISESNVGVKLNRIKKMLTIKSKDMEH